MKKLHWVLPSFCLLFGVCACQFSRSSAEIEKQRLAFADRAPVKIYHLVDSTRVLRDLQCLSADSMEGRETGTAGALRARQYILQRFANYGLQTLNGQREQPFSFGAKEPKTQGVNVFGYVPGVHYPGKYIVVSAHYDHLGIRDGEIFNGADDNASGVAALLALVEYCAGHAPLHSIIFCAFDAEEKGLKGAEAFMQNLPVPKKDIVFNLNMDMVSRSDKRELFFCGAQHFSRLREITENLPNKTNVKILFGHDQPGSGSDDWTMQSDHGIFHQEKIPFLYLGVEDHADYHKASDEVEKIDKGFFVEVCNLIVETLVEVDKKIGI